MDQQFHVVRCFKCQSFQVQQVKKVDRWCCKLCGEKQSLLKEFGRGSGAYCRHHVQKLNAMRGAVMEKQEHHALSLWEQVKEAKENRGDKVTQNHVSRWSRYLDPPEETDPKDNYVLMDRQELHSPNFIDRPRKRSYMPEQSKYAGPKPVRLQATARPMSLNHASLHSLGTTSAPTQNWPHPPSKKHESLSSVRTSSRWDCYLHSDGLVQEREGPSGLTNPDMTEHARTPTMFQSGETFRLDDAFLGL